MKKITLFLVLTIFTFQHSIAQEWDQNTTWVYSQITIPPEPNIVYNILQVDSDTLIQDQVYSKILFQNFDAGTGMFSPFQNNPFLLQYQNGQVHHIINGDSIPRLIYDFNLEAGESYMCHCDFSGEEFEVFIDSTTLYEYQGEMRKIQFVSSGYDKGCEMNGRIIEGMGYEDYILPVYTTVDPPPGGFIQCFNDGNFRYPTGETCLEVVNVEELPIDNITLFPNPTSHSVVIQGGDFSTYSLRNLDGRMIQRGQLTTNTIDLSSVPVGTYFIELIQEGKRVFKKIVKMD